jgi:hypothetical protein
MSASWHGALAAPLAVAAGWAVAGWAVAGWDVAGWDVAGADGPSTGGFPVGEALAEAAGARRAATGLAAPEPHPATDTHAARATRPAAAQPVILTSRPFR